MVRMKTSRPNCQYYDNETRKKLLELLAHALYMAQKSLNDSNSENRESLEKEYNNCQSNIKMVKAYSKDLKDKKDNIVATFRNCCEQAYQARIQYVNSLPTIGQ